MTVQALKTVAAHMAIILYQIREHVRVKQHQTVKESDHSFHMANIMHRHR